MTGGGSPGGSQGASGSTGRVIGGGSTAGEGSRDATVSVVIPTYYRNDRLRGALESVADQAYTPVETVVVDDSGERHAAPVAAEFDVQYHPMEDNVGPQAAREAGVRATSGRYVQFLDDDDRLLPGKFETQVPVLAGDSAAGVVYSGLEWAGGPTVRPDLGVQGDVLADALRFQTAPCMMGTMLVERDVIEAIMPFEHTHGADDIGMKVELARTTEFRAVDEVLLRRGNPEGSVSTSQAAVDGRWAIIDHYEELYAEFPPAVRRAAVAETHFMQGRRLLEERPWSPAALAAFARAAYHAPGLSVPYVGALVAAVFGRPGYRLSRRLYSAFVLGGDRSGKRL
jgi:hypothetical protein